jgi:eight-cysteine-cluster-containing protein
MKYTWILLVILILIFAGWLLLKYSNMTESVVVDNPDIGECFIGGCSSQVCSEDPEVITTCEWREEYACYQSASCERQIDGECGWTETSELLMCLGNANL